MIDNQRGEMESISQENNNGENGDGQDQNSVGIIDKFAVEIRHFESGLTHKQLIFENRYLDNFLSYDHQPSQVLSAR